MYARVLGSLSEMTVQVINRQQEIDESEAKPISYQMTYEYRSVSSFEQHFVHETRELPSRMCKFDYVCCKHRDRQKWDMCRHSGIYEVLVYESRCSMNCAHECSHCADEDLLFHPIGTTAPSENKAW